MKTSRRFVVILFSIAPIAAIITTLISLNIIAIAAPTFASGKLIAGRTWEGTEDIQDPLRRAEYISIPASVVDSNPKLKMVLEGADTNYEINIKSKGNAPAVDPGYEVSISEEEANVLAAVLADAKASQKTDDNYVSEFHRLKLENEGKYYVVTVVTVGTL